jgi:inner membrane transporter RhtA
MDTPTPLTRAVRFRPPAAMLVATSGVSGQCGAAIATKLFTQVGPAGTLTLRLVLSTVALVMLARPKERDWRRLVRPARRNDLAVMVAFGLVIAGMNLSFYESIARIPLGVAVTVEFVGPLTISVVGSRRWTDVVWAVLAGAGVLLLASGSIFGVVHHLDLAGVGFALVAGTCWATYIILNKETGRRFQRNNGLAGAMAVAALLVTPFGALQAGATLVRPTVLGIGVAVALLSSVIPYSCEMAALRRATPRAFGILLSMAPGLAALAGLAILGQGLSSLEVGALLLVVAANVGSAWLGTRATSTPSRVREATLVKVPEFEAAPSSLCAGQPQSGG